VAYLDDGTMVVVDGGRRMINKRVDVIVTSVHQTTAGKMIFGRLEERAEQAAPALRQAAAAGVATAMAACVPRQRSSGNTRASSRTGQPDRQTRPFFLSRCGLVVGVQGAPLLIHKAKVTC